jgi:predicted TPR repeat methyltransferase
MANPTFLSSGNLLADRRFEWARDCAAKGDLAAAADLYLQATDLAPDFASAWFALGQVRVRLGDAAGAAEAFDRARAADPDDRHGAALQLARLTGEAAPMPAGYVRAMFDQYAPYYDLSLLEGLNYRGPTLLFDAVAAACAKLGRALHFKRALDFGCGTGLAGMLFRPHVDSLVGVDLSPAMIEQARRAGCYHHLHVADVMDFLAGEHEAGADLVIAADSLPYIAGLAPLCRALARVLERGGIFAFTVETHDGDGVLLRETLRYAHGTAHVRAALGDADFQLLDLTGVSSRTEKGVPVPGLLTVAMRV